MLSKRIVGASVTVGALLIAGWFMGVFDQTTQYQANGRTMGTTWQVRYVVEASNTDTTPAMVEQAITDTLQSVNQSMSTYIADSELMQLNKAPVNMPIKVSPELFTVVDQAQSISALSKGAYDVTAGALVNLWGFGSVNGQATGQNGQLELLSEQLPVTITETSQAAFLEWMAKGGVAQIPSAEQVKAVQASIGYQSLQLNEDTHTITKTRPVFIDLSSIAKGYGVDLVAEALESLGIGRYMVEIGGEIRTQGRKQNGESWKLAVREPVLENRINTVVALDDRAIATSGDYLNYYEVDGVHFSHLIDARTGYPVEHRLASVAVIADETSLADALATMFMILGDEQGIKLAEQQQIDAYFIYHTDKGFAARSTANFDSYRVDK